MTTKQGGFTLIETMIAMMVSSIMLLGLAGMLITTIKTNKTSESRMTAATTASSIISKIEASAVATPGYSQATANNDATALLPAGSSYTPTVTMTPAVAIQGHEHIVVQLAWMDHGVPKNVSVQSQVVIP